MSHSLSDSNIIKSKITPKGSHTRRGPGSSPATADKLGGGSELQSVHVLPVAACNTCTDQGAAVIPEGSVAVGHSSDIC